MISLQSYFFFLNKTSFLKKNFKATLHGNVSVTACKTMCCKKGSISYWCIMQQFMLLMRVRIRAIYSFFDFILVLVDLMVLLLMPIIRSISESVFPI